jgi:23S rRNA pseudouridine2605 synthase
MRINKFLSLCGLGSRRKVEELIVSGKIKINGELVRDLSIDVDVERDCVEYGRKRISPQEYTYLILNKPRGYITTASDDLGRQTVMDLIPPRLRKAGVVPVGRLDRDSEGLLLFTNDGDVANALTHPRFEVEKCYEVVLDRPLDDETKAKIESGVVLEGKKTGPARVKFLDQNRTKVSVRIHEGKKRHIRVAFQLFRYRVKKLKRVSMGPLRIDGVNSGSYRMLKKNEIAAVRSIASSMMRE